MGRSDARFRREYFGFVSAKQVSADFPSGCTGNCTSGGDQFTHANAVEADFAWRARRLSRQRDLGLQPGRSRQSAWGRLQPASRNARNIVDRDSPRTHTDLAGWRLKIVSDTGV